MTDNNEQVEGVQPGCTGDYECPAPAHLHGCFTDTEGHCSEPGDHIAASLGLAVGDHA